MSAVSSTVELLPTDWQEQVRALAAERDAVILAHNYQLPEIQDIAHHTGDSLGLSRLAAEATESTIVFCGVHLMRFGAVVAPTIDSACPTWRW